MNTPPPLLLNPEDASKASFVLPIEAVVEVARAGRVAALGAQARVWVASARAVLEQVAAGEKAVYGVNTGFGSLSRHRIDQADLEAIQRNIVRSHAAGIGPPLDKEVVRAMQLVLAASLARGASGVQERTLDTLLALLNAGITPVVPEVGSVGASGDLAPLAHAALVLIGEGEAIVDGVRMSGAAAIEAAGIKPATLGAKEGLALLNGTHLMAGTCALAASDCRGLIGAAVGAAAMAIDACRASVAPLDDRIHVLRNQRGQRDVAAVMSSLLDASTIVPDHADDDPRVQDPYSLRATPQVLGAVLDALRVNWQVVQQELGAVTDNPLIVDDTLVSGANFHGMGLAMTADATIVALTHLAGISERRMYWILSGHDCVNHVPASLSPSPGLHSGWMIVQYTAAACCNELQALSHPASVGNVPTSAGIEDYNSMGATSARRLRRAVDLARSVVAMELLIMAEGLEHQRPLRSGEGVEAMYAAIREHVGPLTEDRSPAPDIACITALIHDGALPIPEFTYD
jgi:histidine ammonia-lyase